MNRPRAIRLLLAMGVLVTAGWLLRGYITDDTFIHLRYAHNLIELGEFSFNPGESSYGATSPLWIFGLALLLKLGVSPFAAAWLLGVLSGVMVILLMDAILEQMSVSAIWKGAILLLAACDAWFLRWTFSGMETPLSTGMLLLLLWPLVSGRDVGWGVSRGPLWQRYLAWGAGAGLAGLVRPELMLVAPLALPWLMWFEYFRAGAVGGPEARHRARPHRPLLAAIGGWLVVTVPWLTYAWIAFGRLTPGTAAAKSSTIAASPLAVMEYLLASVRQLAVVQGLLWLVALALVIMVLIRNSMSQNARLSDSIAEDLPAPSRAAEFDPARTTPGHGPWSVWGPVALVGIAVTWTVALLGGYAIKQVWIISRYVAPVAPVLLLALTVIGEWLMGGREGDRSRRRICISVIVVGVVATLLLNGWILTTQIVPHARKFSVGVKECYLAMGEWLGENTPEDTVIAALDIGAVGYGSQRHVLDLMGLVSPEILDLGREVGFAEMVESGAWLPEAGTTAEVVRPDYFIDRSEGVPRWDGRVVRGVRFDLIDTCILEGVGIREPQPWTVALYRLELVDTRVKAATGG